MKYFELLFQTLNPVLIGLEFESLGIPRSLATSSPVLAKWEEFSENLRCMGGGAISDPNMFFGIKNVYVIHFRISLMYWSLYLTSSLPNVNI